MIAFACPRCGKTFQVKEEFAGRNARCPACKTRLVVPALVPPAPISPAAVYQFDMHIRIAALAVASLVVLAFFPLLWVHFGSGGFMAFLADSSRPPGDDAKAKEPEKPHPLSLLELQQPRERYRAEWPKSMFLQSRELDFSSRRETLKVEVMIHTERDVPIKELHGHLAFVKDKEVIYETQVAEKPNVSFTNMHFVSLRIPYDDDNPKHRTLRFAKDNELTPVFTVRKVVLADGEERNW